MAVQPRKPPYEMSVHARTCRCNLPPSVLGRTQTAEKAIAIISGYWNVYLAFWGEQVLWLRFHVVDVRDGRIIWENGRATRESGGFDGIEQQDQAG